ncbi:MAG TPA: hypothetical protein PKE31_03445 [Pseudomonadota bacterium]|nr:hypothetical protein [Pseudomonadota bacterium]
MTRYLNREQYLMELRTLRISIQDAHNSTRDQRVSCRQELNALVSRSETALSELAQAILPDLSPNSIQRAVAMTGYTTLSATNPAAELERAQGQLAESITTRADDIRDRLRVLQQLPEFQNRLLLRAPNTGTLVRQIAELSYFRDPYVETLRRCDHPRLLRLLEVNYGLPSYSVPFWRLSYYADWKAGDEILAKFGGDVGFATVRAEFLTARDAVSAYDRKLSALREEVAQGEAIEREHESLGIEAQQIQAGQHPLQEQYLAMPQQFLKDARIRLERYLADVNLVEIGDRLERYPEVEGLAKRYHGLKKQAEYLRKTSSELLANSESSLSQTLSKMDRDIRKHSDPRHAGIFSDEALHKIVSRQRRSIELLNRQRMAQAAIVGFAAYEMGRLDEDCLWWDVITDGKVKANYIDEVAQFKAMHPEYKYRRMKRKPGETEIVDDGDLELVEDAAYAIANAGLDSDLSPDIS